MAAIISRWVFFQIGINGIFFFPPAWIFLPSPIRNRSRCSKKSRFWVRVEQFKPTRSERGGKYYFKRQSFGVSRLCFTALKWNTSANTNKWGKWRKISPLCIGREAEQEKTWGKDLSFFHYFFFPYEFLINLFLRWVFINYLSPAPTPRTRTRPRSVFPWNGNIFLSSGSPSTVRAMI